MRPRPAFLRLPRPLMARVLLQAPAPFLATVFLVLPALSGQAWCEDAGAAPPAPSVPTEVIEVRGDAGEGATADPTVFATVIRAEDFAGRVTTLSELLRAAAGVQINSLGGEFATVSIRASSAEQVMVYLDGVPLNRALGGAVNLADLPLDQVESITIYRSFTPAGLPAASIGGAIVVRTRQGAPETTAPTTTKTVGSASLTYGSLATAEAMASASGRLKVVSYSVGIGAARSDADFEYLDDGGTDQNPQDDVIAERANNDSERLQLTGRAGFQVGPRARAGLTVDLLDREQGAPGRSSSDFELARLDDRRALLRADFEVPGLWGGQVTARAAADYTRLQEDYTDPQPDAVVGWTDTDLDAAGLEASLLWVASAHHAVTFLASRRHETADLHGDTLPTSDDLGDAVRDTTGLVMEDQIALAGDRMVLNPSVRFDAYDNSFHPGAAVAVYPTTLDAADAFTTGKVGFRIRVSDGITIRGNAGSFVRLPSFTELFGYRGSVKGNPALEPERGRSTDLGVLFEGSSDRSWFRKTHVEITLFATDADNLILFWPNSQGTVLARNAGESRVRGVEARLALALGRRLTGDFNWTEQRAESAAGPSKGSLLPGRPSREVSAAARLDLGRGCLIYEFTYVGLNYVDRFETASSALPSRYIHDLAYRHMLPRGLEGTIEIKNIGDEMTYDVSGFPLPGRTAHARVSWSF